MFIYLLMGKDFIANIKLFLVFTVAVVVGVIGITAYLDERAEKMFYARTRGELLEERVKNVEAASQRLEIKIDDLRKQQQEILIQLGIMNEGLKRRE